MYRESLDKRNLRLEEITREVQNLKDIISEYEVERQSLRDRESELRLKTQNLEKEHHDKLNSLRRDLDTTSLHCSELMLEKSKLENEKLVLEQQMQKFNAREANVHRQVGEFKREFGDIKQGLQQQLTQLESDKTQLEKKILELETANIELYSRLIGTRKDREETRVSRSLPGSPNVYDRSYSMCNMGSTTGKASSFFAKNIYV